jgi:hypothetical protein
MGSSGQIRFSSLACFLRGRAFKKWDEPGCLPAKVGGAPLTLGGNSNRSPAGVGKSPAVLRNIRAAGGPAQYPCERDLARDPERAGKVVSSFLAQIN